MLPKAFPLALLVAASSSPAPGTATPIVFDPPAGWSEQPAPQGVGIDRIWLPPRSEAPGESLVLVVVQRDGDQTLHAAVDELVSEETADGRKLMRSKTHDTCRGTLPGWDVELRIEAPPSPMQFYHVVVAGGRTLALLDTRKLGTSLSSEVEKTIDSICPSTPA